MSCGRRFTAAIVLCDSLWADPDRDSANGIDVRVQLDFLRLDSMIMMVQLNIREILSVRVHGWHTWQRHEHEPTPSLSLVYARMNWISPESGLWRNPVQVLACEPAGMLQDKCRDDPDINIVCEKVAFEGVTKFEDR